MGVKTNNYITAQNNQDSETNWITGFAESCGHTTNINAELRAIFYGLQLTYLGPWIQRHHLQVQF